MLEHFSNSCLWQENLRGRVQLVAWSFERGNQQTRQIFESNALGIFQ